MDAIVKVSHLESNTPEWLVTQRACRGGQLEACYDACLYAVLPGRCSVLKPALVMRHCRRRERSISYAQHTSCSGRTQRDVNAIVLHLQTAASYLPWTWSCRGNFASLKGAHTALDEGWSLILQNNVWVTSSSPSRYLAAFLPPPPTSMVMGQRL